MLSLSIQITYAQQCDNKKYSDSNKLSQNFSYSHVFKRNVPAFKSINMSGLAVAYFNQGPKDIKLKLTGIQPTDVVTEVRKGVLYVSTIGNHNGEDIKIYISNPTIQKIELDDVAEFYCAEAINAQKLRLIVNDHSSARLSVDTKDLSINMNGGDLRIKGKTKTLQIENNDKTEHGSLNDYELIVGK